MPFVDPQSLHNPATGNSPPASWGDEVRAGLVWCAGDSASGNAKPMCRIYNSAAQNISTALFTALSFNSERYDVGGMHSTSALLTRITVPTGGAGVYHLGASVRFEASPGGSVRVLRLRLNGATYLTGNETAPVGSSGDTQLTVSCDYKLAEGDYIEAVVFQNAGVTLQVLVTGAYSPEMWAHWVGVG